MPKSLPYVRSRYNRPEATLYGWVDRERLEISLDSPAWFAWLQQERSFRFEYTKEVGQQVKVTVRPERRGQRVYWQAWKTIKGHSYKRYLGAAPKLSKASLDAAGEWFFDQVQHLTPRDDSLLLYAAVTDLLWLIERLLEQHPDSPLAPRAEAELQRIRLLVGN